MINNKYDGFLVKRRFFDEVRRIISEPATASVNETGSTA